MPVPPRRRRDGEIDPGIAGAVAVLRGGGIETYESCQGGPGHAFSEPTVRFHGQPAAGFHAVGIALDHGWPLMSLRRGWDLVDGELTGPYWELTFWAKVPVPEAERSCVPTLAPSAMRWFAQAWPPLPYFPRPFRWPVPDDLSGPRSG